MLLKNLDDLETNGRVGDWCFVETDKEQQSVLYLFLRYPIKGEDQLLPEEMVRGDIVNLPLSGTGHPVWQWDGNKESPTLSPSIRIRTSDKERWHGYLREGKLITV